MIKRMIKNISLLDIILFMILFLSGGFLASNDIIPPSVTKVLWLLIVFILLFRIKTKINYSIIVFIILCAFMLLSTIINDGNISVTFFTCVGILIAFFTIQNYGFNKVKESYIKILKFLCAISLIMTVAFIAFPGLNNYFRVWNSNHTATFTNLIIFVRNNNEKGIGRNCGMFWEPGAFQTFISFAFIFEISKKKPSIIAILLFTTSIITTFSTTGYFALALIYILMIFNIIYKNYVNRAKLGKMIVIILIASILIGIANYDFFFSTSGYTTFGKLLLYRDSNSYRDSVSSVSIRINSIIKPILIFINNPLLGVGDITFREMLIEETLGVTSCTLSNWFAIYGIIPAIIILAGIIKLCKELSNKALCRLILFLIVFLITISENYCTNSMINLLFLLSFSKCTFVEKIGNCFTMNVSDAAYER